MRSCIKGKHPVVKKRWDYLQFVSQVLEAIRQQIRVARFSCVLPRDVPFPEYVIQGREFIPEVQRILGSHHWALPEIGRLLEVIRRYYKAGGTVDEAIAAAERAAQSAWGKFVAEAHPFPDFRRLSRAPAIILTKSFVNQIDDLDSGELDMLLAALVHQFSEVDQGWSMERVTRICAYPIPVGLHVLTVFECYRYRFDAERDPLWGRPGVDAEDLKWKRTFLLKLQRSAPSKALRN